ncbi:MAG TPA: FtsK/SpoIIIE domain-containing protein [Symbiobacteriaceae bacterium]|jgi:hypothetical protein
MTAAIIADAIYRILQQNLKPRAAAEIDKRAFFRLDGFDNEVYRELCDRFRAHGNTLERFQVIVRAVDSLGPGYEAYQMEPGRTATYWRNHVPVDHALVLIFNKATSDRQSLANLFIINESLVSCKYLELLVGAAFGTSLLPKADADVLRRFIRIFYAIREPQLQSLVRFLAAVKAAVITRHADMHTAIGEALPALQLFKSAKVTSLLAGPKDPPLSTLLRRINSAANHELQSIERKDVDRHLERLDAINFDDDPEMTAEAKRTAIVNYLRGTEMTQALQIDWDDIELMLSNRSRQKRKKLEFNEQLKSLGGRVQEALAKAKLDNLLDDEQRGMVNQLLGGSMPDMEAAERVFEEFGKGLGAKLCRDAGDVLGIGKATATGDFPLGVAKQALKLLGRFKEVPEDLKLRVRLIRPASPNAEARMAFQMLYGQLASFFFSMEWEIGPLLTPVAPEESVDADEDDPAPVVIEFEVVATTGGEVVGREPVTWQYIENSPAADLVEAVRRLRSTVSAGKASIPIFTAPLVTEAPDVGALAKTIGHWWEAEPASVRAAWETGPEQRRGMNLEAVKQVAAGMEEVEEAFANLLEGAPQGILFHVEPFLGAYDKLLQTMGAALTTDQEITLASDLVNRAWTVTDPDQRWLVVPLLHPLKLLWYLNRVRHFNALLNRLLAPGPLAAVDMPWLQRDIEQRFSSAYFPAVLVYNDKDGQKRIFLPADEVGGTELFRPAATAKGHVGSAVNLAEADRASLKNAAVQVKRSLTAYMEAYPFARAGMEILLANVESPALPIAILEELKSTVNLGLTVHCRSGGASVFSTLNDWILQNEALRVPAENSYFPTVRVRVQEGELGDYVQSRHFDAVVLVDTLAEAGQEVTFKMGEQQAAQSLADFTPFFQPILDPFAHGAARREMSLTPRELPSVVRRFYNSLAASAAPHDRPLATDQPAVFRRILQLGGWQKELRLLHERAVWVICYDINADRFLLEQTADKEHLHIIRYVQGLGPKKLHNLTVSSSYRAREDVVRRVTQRLQELLPDYRGEYRQELALALVNRAQQMSGSIILQAAGPGSKLNELLGLVMTKRKVEEAFRAAWPDCLITWVYLDDYREWFGTAGKRPDILVVAARLGEDGKLELRLCVAEAKMVTDAAVESEQEDALRQVRRALGILVRAFEPGRPFVDSEYWYDQLYRAIVSNLEFKADDEAVVAALSAVRSGDYRWTLQGDAWVFSYDRPPVGKSEIADESADEALYAHAVNRRGTRRVLDALLRETVGDQPDLPAVEVEPIRVPEEIPAAETATTGTGVEWAPPEIFTEVAHPDTDQAESDRHEVFVEQTTERPDETAAGGSTAGTEEMAEEAASLVDQQQTPVDDLAGVGNLASGLAAPTQIAAAMLADYDTRGDETAAMQYAQECLDKTVRFLRGFDQLVKPADILVGPRVIRLKLGLTISKTSNFRKVSSQATDLRLHLKLEAMPLIQAGNDGTVWVDIPRPRPAMVGLKPLLANMGEPRLLPETRFPLGVTMDNSPFIADLRKVTHWLVGGTSGSGKSVFLRSVLLSLMLTNTPDTIQFVIIDPKGDLVAFRDSPFTQQYIHTRMNLAEVACTALQGVKRQMDARLELMLREHMVNEIDEYHRVEGRLSLPRIVTLIEEYGDLISDDEHAKELNSVVAQIAGIGRAPGFHLFICTQNPLEKTVNSDIKANCSGRVALWVKTHINSQVILGEQGAEELLKNGDMLFKSDGPPVRIQAPFVDNLRELQPILKRLAEQYPSRKEER